MVNLIFIFFSLLSAQRSEVVNTDPRKEGGGGGGAGGQIFDFFRADAAVCLCKANPVLARGKGRTQTLPTVKLLHLNGSDSLTNGALASPRQPNLKSIGVGSVGRGCPSAAPPAPRPSWGPQGYLPPGDGRDLARPI